MYRGLVKTMKKILLILALIIPNAAQAAQIVYPTIYGPNSQVTNVTLNGNNNAISAAVNGGLDNSNANTTSGYRFYQTVAVLPAAGSQGAVYFLTSDNSLNFDTGSAFNKSVSVNSPVSGDTVYYNSGWNRLGIGTSGQVITSNGSVPSWSSNPTVPIGGIILWSGSIASIPSNWQLCNGTNSTPDLRNKFILAADADVAGVAESTYTGSATQTGGSLHHTHSPGTLSLGNGGSIPSSGSSYSNSTLGGNTGNENTVPVIYFVLAYIERMS